MDDVVILSGDKKTLHEYLDKIIIYLRENLHLELKGNYQIFPVNKRGIDFVGYKFFRNYILLRDSTKRRMVKKLHKIAKKCKITKHDFCTFNSYKGWLNWCNSYRLYEKYFTPLEDRINDYYENHLKKKGKKE